MPTALGVNHNIHESSIAIVDESGIVFAASEERFSRVKFDASFPRHALEAAFDHVGIAPSDLLGVGMSFPPDTRVLRNQLRLLFKRDVAFSRHNVLAPLGHFVTRRGAANRPSQIAPAVPVTWFSHHLSHALTATVAAGIDECAVIVADGKGARAATSLWRYRDGALQLLRRIDFPNSLGLFYASVTEHLGFEAFSDEWKVMGLAAYGAHSGLDLSPVIRVTDDGYVVDGRGLIGRRVGDTTLLDGVVGSRRGPEEPLTDRHRDIAFAAQAATEEALLSLGRAVHRLTGTRALCLSGGVAMNCKANGRLLNEGPFEFVFVPPGASDEGSSVGAAAAVLAASGQPITPSALPNALLGRSFADPEIEEMLTTCGLRFKPMDDPEEVAADHLACGRIVARFRGRGEFGARAMGARSILAHPGDTATRDRVNAMVKYREDWRPFAPMVMEEEGSAYFRNFIRSPFMTLTFDALDSARRDAAAIVHADGTARVQSIAKDDDPQLWRLLDAFRTRTGVPILLNTSFNLKGEPIVNTPRDAIRTFFSSGLEVLMLEHYEVTK